MTQKNEPSRRQFLKGTSATLAGAALANAADVPLRTSPRHGPFFRVLSALLRLAAATPATLPDSSLRWELP